MAKSTQTVKLPRISFAAAYRAIGVESGKTIPADRRGEFSGVRLLSHYGEQPIPELPPVTLRLYASAERHGLHRLFVVCPKCVGEVPFANLPSHYTTKSCRNGERHERAKVEMPEEAKAVFTAAKVPGGYVVMCRGPHGFHGTAHKPDGTQIARISAAFADNERFSMFVLNPHAFADWFAELENPPAMGHLRPATFDFWKAAFLAYAVAFRPVDYETASELAMSHYPKFARRPERKMRRTSRKFHAEMIQQRFDWLL